MKRTIFSLLLTFAIGTLLPLHTTVARAQEKDKVEICEVQSFDDDDTVFGVVEEMPEFPGGMRALMDYLKKEIHYPKKCLKEGIEGRTFINFVVSSTGKIKNVKVTKSSGNKKLDKEAVRVVKKMPRWIPGKQSGKSVNVRFTLPVTFRLDNSNSIKEKAGKRRKEDNPIVGIWQLCTQIVDCEGKNAYKPLPAIKIINANNTFCSMFLYTCPDNGRIMQRGRYKMTGEGTYIEKITEHRQKNMVGSMSMMSFKFIDENKLIMEVEFDNPNAIGPRKEYWKRLQPIE